MGKSLLTGFLLIVLIQCRAQVDFSPALWQDIDSSIGKKERLKSLAFRVDQLLPAAFKQGNNLAVARCLDYQLRLRDLLTEDSLYFHNSRTIDSLLRLSQLPAELKASLHLQMARRLYWFARKYIRFSRILYERKEQPVNYAALSNQALCQLGRDHFIAARQLAAGLKDLALPDILWMSSDPLQFLFKPAYYDILTAEQITLEGKGYSYENPFTQEDSDVFAYSPDVFIQRMGQFRIADTVKRNVIRLYQEWLTYNRSAPGTYYFIESLARKYCFDLTQMVYDHPDEWMMKYEQYLNVSTKSDYNSVKAYAIYQLCLIWNQQAKKYCPEFDHYGDSYRKERSGGFDTVYRYHGVKALRLFRNNRQALDSFNYLKNILLRMEEQLQQREVEIRLEEYSLPGKPILTELRFRNTDTLYYRIMQNSYRQFFFYKDQKEYFKQVLNLPLVREEKTVLPAMNDFNRHISYLKLEALPVGFYYLVFSERPIGAGNGQMKMVSFKVSGLTALDNGDRLYVLDRQTGHPKNGAMVNTSYTVKAKNGLDSTVYQLLRTNASGYTVLRNERIKSAEVVVNADTIKVDDIRVGETDTNDDIYDKEEYEDLVEYFEEHAEMHIYTDRSIYRPGQTVFYKAILLTKHPETGETVLMNPATMGRGLFNRTYKKWLKESEPLLTLEDVFGKTIDSVYFRPDAFGAFSGTFKLPADAATGEWEISPDYIDKQWDDGRFRVEEYKRPSYEITIDKPVRVINPGDSIEFNVKLRSFAGAALNQVKVEYTLTAQGNIPGGKVLQQLLSYRQLLDTAGQTDMKGLIQVRYKDRFFDTAAALPDTSWKITYTLHATAFDASGEVYEKELSQSVSSRPVTITYNGTDKIDRSVTNRFSFSTRDLNAGVIKRKLQVQLFRLPSVQQLKNNRTLMATDTWLYPVSSLRQWFPSLVIAPVKESPEVLVLATETVSESAPFFEADTTLLQPGHYRMEVRCIENGQLKGRMERSFSVFDSKQQRLPAADGLFRHLPFNTCLPGEKISMNTGFPVKDFYVIRELQYYTSRNRKKVTRVYQERMEPGGLQKWEWKVPATITSDLQISQLIVYENQLYSFDEKLYVNVKQQQEPEIIVERYRSRLQPGASETFSVSIKSKDPKAIAELMTVMYDASLDQLEPHKWKMPAPERSVSLSSDWATRINYPLKSYGLETGLPYYEYAVSSPGHATALWWLNPLDYGYGENDVMGDWNNIPLRKTGSYDFDKDDVSPYSGNGFARLPGLELANSRGLNEVVVVGYGVNVNHALAGKVSGVTVTIRGSSSLLSNAQPLIVLDGVVYEGDLSKLDPNLITAAMVLKGADATAIYGSRASSGVLILSTKGDIILPGQEAPPPIPPRKNFNETAFFFPSIHADHEGYFSFRFTMPESVTEWNWKMLAHTKKAKFAYAERKLQTQLPLMVQASTPRVLYQGDRLVLKHRISNLDTSAVNGQVSFKLEDMVTGEDLTPSLKFAGTDRFSLAPKATGYTSTELRVPERLQHPVKLVLTVRSSQFADAEEHIIPVLSKEVFVRQSQSFSFAKTDTVITTVPLTNDARLFGMGLTIQPQRQSAILNALPYLAEYPWDCAEQLVSKIQALTTSVQLMRSDKSVQESFAKAKQVMKTPETGRQSLPADFPAVSMPWLEISRQSANDQAALFRTLDSSRSKSSIDGYMDKLYALQQANRGLSWFPGGVADPWISQYVLGSFGQMKQAGLLNTSKLMDDRFSRFINELTNYCDQAFIKPGIVLFPMSGIEMLWSRSYWLSQSPLDSGMRAFTDSLVQYQWSKVSRLTLARQALLIILTTRYYNQDHALYRKALEQAVSIREQAVEDPVNGIRWKSFSDQEELTYSGEETIRLLAEAFESTIKQEDVVRGMLQWILSAREGHHWSSTRSTAAVIQLLGRSGKSLQDPTITVTTAEKGERLAVTNDLLSGSPVAFQADSSKAASVRLTKTASGTARGSLVWYYFTGNPQAVNPYQGLNIKKQVSRQNAVTHNWELLKPGEVLKQGDELRITLTIESENELRYVLIHDRRSSALEPLETRSEYVYGSIPHYRSVRDDGNRLFADLITAGRRTISYTVRVLYEGEFNNGVASIGCMYRPDISAYSESMRLKAEGSK